MALDSITTLSSIKAELEAGWKLFDDVYATLDAGQWSKKFGRTWTYAEQPYHMAYFDRMIATSLTEGSSTVAGRLHLRSLGDINDWNRREFARRKPGHSVQDSLAEMRQSRDALRHILTGMTEPDLDQKAWMPLIFGWTTKRGILQAAIIHNVAEYWKVWMRTGKQSPAPSPAAVHLRLAFMMEFMPATMNRELAARTPFTMVWNFTGLGGGSWTFRVADGKCTVTETAVDRPDLAITMKPETFHKMVAKMTPPPLLILTGQMKIKGFGKMGTFGKLFPEPKPDRVIEPDGGGPAVG